MNVLEEKFILTLYFRGCRSLLNPSFNMTNHISWFKLQQIFMRYLLTFSFLFLSVYFFGQHTTISQKNTEKTPVTTKHKMMLIPFEPHMYMSEIDFYINKETKLTARQIKFAFRDGINEQLYKALKTQNSVVDLMDDTVKTKKDLESIYQHLAYEYQKVPDQAHYSPPKKEKEEKKIEKGQIVIETNTDVRFMNAKIKNATLVPYLYGKYKSDIFIFINQLDIKASGTNGPAETGNNSGNRKIVLHYTVYTYDAREINSGIAEEEFPVTLNNPVKIVSTYFSKIAQTITQRINLALNPSKTN